MTYSEVEILRRELVALRQELRHAVGELTQAVGTLAADQARTMERLAALAEQVTAHIVRIDDAIESLRRRDVEHDDALVTGEREIEGVRQAAALIQAAQDELAEAQREHAEAIAEAQAQAREALARTRVRWGIGGAVATIVTAVVSHLDVVMALIEALR